MKPISASSPRKNGRNSQRPGINGIIDGTLMHAAYRVLGLINFFTVVRMKCAPGRARKMKSSRRCRKNSQGHGKGFIRLEVIKYEDLMALAVKPRSPKPVKAH